MSDDADQRWENADYHVAAQARRRAAEAAKAQVLLDRFVAEATSAGLSVQELTAAPWSGGGRYRTGVTGWYLKRDQSVGVGADGAFYELVVPPRRFGWWPFARRVQLDPVPPPLQVGAGGRDGDSVAMDKLLRLRLEWPADGSA